MGLVGDRDLSGSVEDSVGGTVLHTPIPASADTTTSDARDGAAALGAIDMAMLTPPAR